MQRLKPEKREQIIAAARSLFGRYGYAGVGLREIADNADMTVGNIYRYFKGKDDLFESTFGPEDRAVMASAVLSDGENLMRYLRSLPNAELAKIINMAEV